MSTVSFNVDWMGILLFVLKPVLTVAVWYVVDGLLKKLHGKSSFIDRLFVRHAHSKSSRHIVEQRIKTFKGLFVQSLRILNAVFFIFILLGNFHIDAKPLLAGIGVVGLGLSLAAQNILRDFLNGLFIVIEDQYNVGDVVTIGGATGTVEAFTLRATRLRAADGRLITIPNGSVAQVTNSTKDYAVATVNVGVSYDADIPQVMSVLGRCGKILRERMPEQVIADPTPQGIIDFRDNDLLMRVLAKTEPGEQWAVERALRIIIKEEFAKDGIEIPFAQVVHHIADDAPKLEVEVETPVQDERKRSKKNED